MKKAVRVLFVTPELAPFVKTGGLADVSAALPRALRDAGVDARVLVPGYPRVIEGVPLACAVARMPLLPGLEPARLLRSRVSGAGVPLYVLECERLYARTGGPYHNPAGEEWADNWLRFGALSRAASLLGCAASPLRWKPDVVHCNDWQSALAAAYLAFDAMRHARTVMTVHNIAFSGSFPPSCIPALDLPRDGYQMHGFEFFRRVSFLKAGLYYADHITTVSRTYADEIETAAHGGGFHGLLATRHEDLTGILNGIDTVQWDPGTDPHLWATYRANAFEGKSVNKAALQAKLGLPQLADVPIIGMVTRLTAQKGLDLLPAAMGLLADGPYQLVILGSGDRAMERELGRMAKAHDGHMRLILAFDEPLAHQIVAGADLFLMPSRFEPCGLNQMYGMRYGTPPLVRRTGGLADTVADTTRETLAAGAATGFVFDEPTSAALSACLKRALASYMDRTLWRRIQLNGMQKDFGWEQSAARYKALYGQPGTRGSG
jgi:starch synthase